MFAYYSLTRDSSTAIPNFTPWTGDQTVQVSHYQSSGKQRHRIRLPASQVAFLTSNYNSNSSIAICTRCRSGRRHLRQLQRGQRTGERTTKDQRQAEAVQVATTLHTYPYAHLIEHLIDACGAGPTPILQLAGQPALTSITTHHLTSIRLVITTHHLPSIQLVITHPPSSTVILVTTTHHPVTTTATSRPRPTTAVLPTITITTLKVRLPCPLPTPPTHRITTGGET